MSENYVYSFYVHDSTLGSYQDLWYTYKKNPNYDPY